jgi:hypothetical protein
VCPCSCLPIAFGIHKRTEQEASDERGKTLGIGAVVIRLPLINVNDVNPLLQPEIETMKRLYPDGSIILIEPRAPTLWVPPTRSWRKCSRPWSCT